MQTSKRQFHTRRQLQPAGYRLQFFRGGVFGFLARLRMGRYDEVFENVALLHL